MKYESARLTNPAGKLWHIGVDESGMAKNVILPGDPKRCEIVSAMFDRSELQGVNRGNPVYTGTYNDIEVSVMSTGMGGTAVAICVEELKHAGARNLIRMGTCGSLQKDIPPGSFVICTGAVRGDGASAQYIPLEYPAVADLDVVTALRDSARELGVEPILGLVRSHDAFYLESPGAHEGWEERIRPWADAGVKVVENESATLFVVSSLLGGMKAGTILLTGRYLFEGHGGMSSSSPQEYEKNIELMTRITLKAFEKLNESD